MMVKILSQISTHPIYSDLPFMFSGKFQPSPAPLILSPSSVPIYSQPLLVYSAPKSTTSIWLFIINLYLNSTKYLSLHWLYL